MEQKVRVVIADAGYEILSKQLLIKSGEKCEVLGTTENGSDVYQLGDTVKVICTKTDLSSGNIDFQLVEESEGAASCPSC